MGLRRVPADTKGKAYVSRNTVLAWLQITSLIPCCLRAHLHGYEAASAPHAPAHTCPIFASCVKLQPLP